MPYGIGGPRITVSGAASVLMRYLGLLKTDTSYTMKILYSVEKAFGYYQFRMLMPPPSPLQDIIIASFVAEGHPNDGNLFAFLNYFSLQQGPKATTKGLAKQLVRVEACKRLHEAGTSP